MASSSALPKGQGRVGSAGIGSSLVSTRTRIGTLPGVAAGPVADRAEGPEEGGDGRPIVDVGDVEDLEAGLAEHAARVGVGPGVLAHPSEDLPRGGLGVATPFGVGEDVELDLPDPQPVELLGERPMGIIQRLGGGLPPGPDQAGHLGAGRQVIRVVRADHLDLVEPDRPVGPGDFLLGGTSRSQRPGRSGSSSRRSEGWASTGPDPVVGISDHGSRPLVQCRPRGCSDGRFLLDRPTSSERAGQGGPIDRGSRATRENPWVPVAQAPPRNPG